MSLHPSFPPFAFCESLFQMGWPGFKEDGLINMKLPRTLSFCVPTAGKAL